MVGPDTGRPRVLVRAPDHLGDGVMALPALTWLAARCELVVLAPGWGPALYHHLPAQVAHRDQGPALAAGVSLAVLLKPSFSAAWQARRAPRRVGLATDHRGLLLTQVVPAPAPGEHRADTLLRIACAALDQAPPGPALPTLPLGAEAAAALPADLPEDAVLLLPGTASGETVRWRGFGALAAALGPRALLSGGPGDEDAIAEVAAQAPRARIVAAPALATLSALAVRARAVVGNDSGLPHLAAAAIRAAGGDPGRVHVVYASTDPARTGPPGTTAWPGPRPPCWPCYDKTCAIGAPCRDAPLAPLLAALCGPPTGQGQP